MSLRNHSSNCAKFWSSCLDQNFVSLFKVVDITSVIQHKGKNTTLVLDDVIVTR